MLAVPPIKAKLAPFTDSQIKSMYADGKFISEIAPLVRKRNGLSKEELRIIIHEKTVSDIPDDELLKRVVKNVQGKRKQARWITIMDSFCLGSTFARQLCYRFNLDPEEIV